MGKIVAYVYPDLPAVRNFGIIRFRGSGLANCLFVASRAFVISHKFNLTFLNPTWTNFSFGPYIRGESDKRHYFRLFKSSGVTGIAKLRILMSLPRISLNNALEFQKGIVFIDGLNGYFEQLIEHQPLIQGFIFSLVSDEIINKFRHLDFSNVIGIHVRLGDYPESRRTSLEWYIEMIELINEVGRNRFEFYLFSDGKQEELKTLISIHRVKKVFFGSSIEDIIALSNCRVIIGSDSTFSAWAAFLGNTPIIFAKRHFGPVLNDSSKELVSETVDKISDRFLRSLID